MGLWLMNLGFAASEGEFSGGLYLIQRDLNGLSVGGSYYRNPLG